MTVKGAGTIISLNGGLQIKVVATSNPGTDIIPSRTVAVEFVEMPFLQVTNQDGSQQELVLECGTTGTDNELPVVCATRDSRSALTGRAFTGTYYIKAHCTTANVLFVSGYILRYKVS